MNLNLINKTNINNLNNDDDDDDDDDDKVFINSIPPSKQGNNKIYTIKYLLSTRNEIQPIDVNDKLPDKSFWRLGKSRSNDGGGGGSGGNTNSGTYKRKVDEVLIIMKLGKEKQY